MKLVISFFFFTFLIFPQWTLTYPPITDKVIEAYVLNNNEDWFTGRGGLLMKRDQNGNYSKINLHTTKDLNGLFFLDQNNAWAFGHNGTLYKTNNRWQSFEVIPMDNNYNLKAFYALSEKVLFVILEASPISDPALPSFIKKSTDGGSSWVELKSTTVYGNIGKSCIQFVNSTVGYAAFVSFYKTTDGGNTWLDMNLIKYGVEQFYFSSESTGWFIYRNRLYKTTDGALSLKNINPNAYFPSSIFFKDGTIAAYYKISLPDWEYDYRVYKSSDGGVTWSSSQVAKLYSEKLTFRDLNIFYDLTGSFIARSSNTGVSWSVENPIPLYYGDAFFLDTKTGWGHFDGFHLGFYVPEYFGVFRTSDAGLNWHQQLSAGGERLFFFNENVGFAFSSDIYKTTNGGSDWYLTFEEGIQPSADPVDILFMDSLNGFDLIYNFEFEYVQLVATTNGGEDWKVRVELREEPGAFRKPNAFLYNNNKFWILYNDSALVSTNSGYSFSQVNNIGGESMFFVDSVNGWLIENDNISSSVKRTTDNGNSFTTIYTAQDLYRLKSIYFLDLQNGYISGDNGTYLTTDGGYSWNLSAYESFQRIRKLPDGTLFGFSDGGGIYFNHDVVVPVELTSFTAVKENKSVRLNWQTATETNNKGFEVQRKSPETDFKVLCFIPGNGTSAEPKNYSYSDELLTSGTYTYRLKQIDFNGKFSYSKEVEAGFNNVSEKFALEQNYPNPFNPTTKIKFSLPVQQMVELKVFDILGNEVAVLIRENLPAGNYEKVWDGSSHASGVYYYRIISGEYQQIKKMVLIK